MRLQANQGNGLAQKVYFLVTFLRQLCWGACFGIDAQYQKVFSHIRQLQHTPQGLVEQVEDCPRGSGRRIQCIQGLMPGIAASLIEFPFDIVRAIVSLLFSGGLSRYRDIRFTFKHAGGALTSVAGRIDALAKARGNLFEQAPAYCSTLTRDNRISFSQRASSDLR